MAQNPEFKYAPMFQLGEDKTEYYLLTKDYVSEGEFEGHKIVKVQPEALTMLSKQCFHDANFLLRRAHNEQVAKILKDPEASENDKYVALTFLRNAESAAKGILPLCQDTGTAIIHGEKGQNVWTGFCDEEALPAASTKPTRKMPCVIPRTHRFRCMKKRTPVATCRLKSTSKQPKAANTSSCAWSRAAALPTSPTSSRKPRPF